MHLNKLKLQVYLFTYLELKIKTKSNCSKLVEVYLNVDKTGFN